MYINTLQYYNGTQKGVLNTEVSTFQRFVIERFHCICMYMYVCMYTVYVSILVCMYLYRHTVYHGAVLVQRRHLQDGLLHRQVCTTSVHGVWCRTDHDRRHDTGPNDAVQTWASRHHTSLHIIKEYTLDPIY